MSLAPSRLTSQRLGVNNHERLQRLPRRSSRRQLLARQRARRLRLPPDPGRPGQTSAFGAPAKTPFGAQPRARSLFNPSSARRRADASAFGSTTTSAFGATQPYARAFGAPAAAPAAFGATSSRSGHQQKTPFGQPGAFGQTGGAGPARRRSPAQPAATSAPRPGAGRPVRQAHGDGLPLHHDEPAYRAKSFEERASRTKRQQRPRRCRAAAGGFGAHRRPRLRIATTTTSPLERRRPAGPSARQRWRAAPAAIAGAAPAPAGGCSAPQRSGARRRRRLPWALRGPRPPQGFRGTPAPAPSAGLFGAPGTGAGRLFGSTPAPAPGAGAAPCVGATNTTGGGLFGAPSPRGVVCRRAGAAPGGLFGSTRARSRRLRRRPPSAPAAAPASGCWSACAGPRRRAARGPRPGPGAFRARRHSRSKARRGPLRCPRARARRLVRQRAGTAGLFGSAPAPPRGAGAPAAEGRCSGAAKPQAVLWCPCPGPEGPLGRPRAPAPGSVLPERCSDFGPVGPSRPAGLIRRAGPAAGGLFGSALVRRQPAGRALPAGAPLRARVRRRRGGPSARSSSSSRWCIALRRRAAGSVAALAQRCRGARPGSGRPWSASRKAEATAKAADRVADGADALGRQDRAARRTSRRRAANFDAALAGPMTYSPAARAPRPHDTPRAARPSLAGSPRSRWAGRRRGVLGRATAASSSTRRRGPRAEIRGPSEGGGRGPGTGRAVGERERGRGPGAARAARQGVAPLALAGAPSPSRAAPPPLFGAAGPSRRRQRRDPRR